ncbi:Ppx/GppA family phosphatase [Nodosilinea sp. LEGE 06152]|uniref:Ppx/GppA phosphatase family protein n=1 Tax=Nodosilinea sp. LEGE 06152 TaxID=2777966 RepID=UPI0018817682|nr:Ppx/GppA phosphatase family protein [Nodosilinea sp. LEGE 06152]MBE9158022.1 Ppx/GppA family phosphatase [Nodosilinea sp. LEGE 06152]
MTGTTSIRESSIATDFANFAPSEITGDRILAAIDVGTNSIHMVVVKIQPDLPAFTIVDREKETVRLGDFNEATGGLSEAAMERAIKALKRCCAIATSLKAEDIVAVATSAVREASNGQAFIERVYDEIGLAINLISGTEEARRIYLGVLSGVEFNGEPHAIIDIGGGSTELILGTGEPHRFLSSTKVGAVRLTAQFVSTDPISEPEFSTLRAYVRGMIEPNTTGLKSHLQPEEPIQLMGTSGTIECLAALVASDRLGLVPDPLNGFQMTYEEVSRLVETLRQATYAERLEMPEMSARRAEIIVAGAVILQEAMGLLNADRITICERALREGVVVDWMLTHGLIEDRMQFQKSVRQRNILKTAKKYKVHLDRSGRVAQFAMDLFEQTRGSLHTWGNMEKEVLWAAAILHNCGHFVSHSSHHKHSYYLIRNGELLGYTETELEVIANIARYHRKSTPKKKHDNYRSLPTRYHRQMVTHLSALLRLAVALDRRGIGAVESIACDFDTDTNVLKMDIIPAHANDDCASEMWNLNYKKDYFEQVFEVKLAARLIAC